MSIRNNKIKKNVQTITNKSKNFTHNLITFITNS